MEYFDAFFIKPLADAEYGQVELDCVFGKSSGPAEFIVANYPFRCWTAHLVKAFPPVTKLIGVPNHVGVWPVHPAPNLLIDAIALDQDEVAQDFFDDLWGQH